MKRHYRPQRKSRRDHEGQRIRTDLRHLPNDLIGFKQPAKYIMEHRQGKQAGFANKFDRLKQSHSFRGDTERTSEVAELILTAPKTIDSSHSPRNLSSLRPDFT